MLSRFKRLAGSPASPAGREGVEGPPLPGGADVLVLDVQVDEVADRGHLGLHFIIRAVEDLSVGRPYKHGYLEGVDRGHGVRKDGAVRVQLLADRLEPVAQGQQSPVVADDRVEVLGLDEPVAVRIGGRVVEVRDRLGPLGLVEVPDLVGGVLRERRREADRHLGELDLRVVELQLESGCAL